MINDAHNGGRRMFGDQLDQLVVDFRQRPVLSEDSTLEEVCSRLARIIPLSSAGIFRARQGNGALEWVYISGSAPHFMSRSLALNHADIHPVLDADRSIQFGFSANEHTKAEYFAGVPAGRFDGAPVGLAVSSDRELDHNELAHLESFGWLAGLLIENARLSSLIEHNEDSSSTARLIGFIAHELRTPLTGIRGNIQLSLMANQKEQHNRIPGRLEAAISGVDVMSAMVQKLLDVSRLERGSFQMMTARAPLRETVDAAIDEITTNCESDMPPVRVDAQTSVTFEHDQAALQRAIGNLIKSIASQTAHDSAIEISIIESNSGVLMRIGYRGERLPDDDLQALTVPLSQTTASREQNDYLSLDLAFTRGVVRQHDGQIEVLTPQSSPDRHEIEIQFNG